MMVFSKKTQIVHFKSQTRTLVWMWSRMSFNLRSGISTQKGLKIVIFSGSCSTLLFDSFEPGVKIRMKENARFIRFPKRPTLYISILKISFNPRSGI